MPCTYISCVAERHMGRESMGTLIQAKMPEEGETLLSRFGGQVDAQEVVLPVRAGGVLPCGASGRWQKE